MLSKSLQIKLIPIEDIIFDELQPRQQGRTTEIADLAKDLDERGQIYPIIVTPLGNKYKLQDGERRVRASQLLEWKEIEAIIITAQTKLEEYELQFVAGMKRLQIKIEEMAKAVERYVEEYTRKNPDGDPFERLCEITGFSIKYYNDIKALIHSDKEFRKYVEKDKIGGYTAGEINNATKDPDFRQGIRDGYVASAKIGRTFSANAPRVLKRILREAEEQDYAPQEKRKLAKSLFLKNFGLLDIENEKEGDYLAYVQLAIHWQKDVANWGLKGLNERQLRHISYELENIAEVFKNRRIAVFGKIEQSPTYKIPRSVKTKTTKRRH